MTAPQFLVRPLQEKDLGEWLRLRKLLWDAISDDDHRTEMVDIVEHPETQFVAVADTGNGRLGGFLEASIRPFVEDCHTDHVGYLEGWFVEPKYRRQGLGAGLVGQAELWARSRDCTEMASDCEVGNATSAAAHAKLGYAETARLVHFRKDLD